MESYTECGLLDLTEGFCDDLYGGSCHDPLCKSKCHCLNRNER